MYRVTIPTIVPRLAACVFMAGLSGPAMPFMAHAQEGSGGALPTLEAEDYDRWEFLGTPSIDPMGRFVAHTISRVDETQELRIRRLDPDTTWVIAWGQRPEFSSDGRWLTWMVGVSPEERESIQDGGGTVELRAWLLDLRGGEPEELGTARSVAFDPTGSFIAMLGYAPDEPDGAGSAMRVVELDEGTEVGFSNVGEMAWAHDAALLAMVLETGSEEGNGVQLYDGSTGQVRGLDAAGAEYGDLAWSEDGSDLAVLRATRDDDDVSADLLAWRGLPDTSAPSVLPAHGEAVPEGLEVSEHRGPAWVMDGARLSFGLGERPEPEADEEEAEGADGEEAEPDADEDPSTVQVWHTNDVRIIPGQQARASAEERATLLSVWDPDAGSVVQIATDVLATTSVAGSLGVEMLDDQYPWGAKFGRRYRDVWTVDLENGERELALERVRYQWVSPEGRYLLSFDGTDYHAMDTRSGESVNLTSELAAAFSNDEWDTPTDGLLPPHGMGGWVEDDEAVLLYDRFDVWRVAPDGSGAERLTEGSADQVVHRMTRLDPEAETYSSDEFYFSIRGEWTEDRGYARWSDGDYERLVLEPKSFRSLRKAEQADVVVYRRESRTDSPDLFVADLDLDNARVVTETNPFMSEYAWTKTELVEYENAEGTRLHGVLLYPANHDPSVQYPMIVYAYEILTPQMHFWEGPTERDYYNYTAWTQNGYFVLLPDIVFRSRDPGVSTAETMAAAIGAVDAQGLINRDKVGFIGHSWGGYEATYLAARTELFATTVAGAPLTDFVSFMGSIHWNPGIAEVDHWETGQARMDVPYWEDPDAHERNSPIHGVHTMTTPLLMAHGDADGVVEFFQATEFYNFARRAEREMVLLVYEGEDHGFRQKANQIDYHRRILEWFGHYLKDEPAPTWITEGIPWLDHDEERARVSNGGSKGKGH